MTDILCNKPSITSNSHIRNPNTVYTYKDIIEIECDSGYQTNIPGNVTCARDGTLNGEIPTCTGNGVFV